MTSRSSRTSFDPSVLSSHDGAPKNVAEDILLVLINRVLVLIPQDGARLDTKKSCLCSQIINSTPS
jgi:hypothetical protein